MSSNLLEALIQRPPSTIRYCVSSAILHMQVKPCSLQIYISLSGGVGTEWR